MKAPHIEPLMYLLNELLMMLRGIDIEANARAAAPSWRKS